MKSKVKRFLCVLLAVALLFTLPDINTIEAASYAGTTIRLEKTEGTVTVKNAAGKEITVDEGGKLLNGYVVTTADKSYAWISLDDKKVLKLDAASQVELEKNKKKLTISLIAGKLFFDVKAKLSGKEEMIVKSSTLVTGIRGTSGTLESDNSGEVKKSGMQVYDGTVNAVAMTIDPGTGTVKPAASLSIEAGTGVSVSSDSNEAPQVSEISADDIPGFAAVAIKEDPVLQGRIGESSNLNVQEIVETADEKLAADEAVMEQKVEALAQEKTEEIAEDKAANESEAAAEEAAKEEGAKDADKSDSGNTENPASGNNAGSGYAGGGWYVPGNNTGNSSYSGRGLRFGERYIYSEADLRDAARINENPMHYTEQGFMCSDYVLKRDIEITGETVEIERYMTLDLDGHKITANNTTYAGIKVDLQGDLTIEDSSDGRGEIRSGRSFNGAHDGYGLIDVSGSLYTQGGKITALNSASSADDQMGIVVRNNGILYLFDTEITAQGYAVTDKANSSYDRSNVTLGAGTTAKSLADYAVYHDSNSTMSIDCTVDGAAGALFIKRGSAEVNEGAVLRTDASVCKEDGKAFNGTDYINCLAVVNNSSGLNSELVIYGGRIEYPQRADVYPFVEVGVAGSILADADKNIKVNFATLDAANSNPDGFKIANTNLLDTVHVTAHAASAGAFRLAVTDATRCKRVILDDDIDIQGECLVVNKDVYVDLNGHRIDANNNANGNIDVSVTHQLVINDSSLSRSGSIVASVDRSSGYEEGLLDVSGRLVMLGGTINAERDGTAEHGQKAVTLSAGGSVRIFSGTVKAGLFAISDKEYQNVTTNVMIGGNALVRSTADYAVYVQCSRSVMIGNFYVNGVCNPVIEGACGAIYAENGRVEITRGTLKTSNTGITSLNNETSGISIPNALVLVNPVKGDTNVNILAGVSFDHPSSMTHPFVQVTENGNRSGRIRIYTGSSASSSVQVTEAVATGSAISIVPGNT